MYIIIYSLNYAPEPIGTGKYTGEMAEWLASRGHYVEVICGLPHYPSWKLDDTYSAKGGRADLRKVGVNGVLVSRAPHFIPTGNTPISARARIRMESTFSLAALRYWGPLFFSRNKPDVVVAVTPPMQIGVWPALYWFFRRVPWVLHVQDLQVDAALRLDMLTGRLGRLLYWVESFLLRRATRVSTITEAMRLRILDKGVPNERTWLFPNWSDINTVRPLPRDNAFRKKSGAKPRDVLVLYSGNMGEKQGLELILEAASLCLSQTRIKFLLVGEGGVKARLMEKAQSMGVTNVRFLPLQPWSLVPEMLAAADIHLVVQRPEAADLVMPSKLTNILAAGRPTVATAAPGTALYEVVSGHKTGTVVPPGDPLALARAIGELAEAEEQRLLFGRNARQYAEENLSREHILENFEAALKALRIRN